MREVDQHAQPVQLVDQLAAEIRQAGIGGLVAAATDQVLRVVRHLHDAYAEFLEQLQVRDLVFHR